MTTILYKDEAEQYQIVQLSARYKADAYGTRISQMLSTISEHDAVFTRISDNHEPTQFHLSAQEADEFAATWLMFRAALQAKREAEEKRVQALLDEVHAIVASCPAIQVEQFPDSDDGPAWCVTVPDIDWNSSHYPNYAYSPESLLDHVKAAYEAYQHTKTPTAEHSA